MRAKNEDSNQRRNFLEKFIKKFKAYFTEYKYSKHIVRFPLTFKNPQL